MFNDSDSLGQGASIQLIANSAKWLALLARLLCGHHLLLLRLEFHVAATITSIYPASEELGSGPQLLWQVL